MAIVLVGITALCQAANALYWRASAQSLHGAEVGRVRATVRSLKMKSKKEKEVRNRRCDAPFDDNYERMRAW